MKFSQFAALSWRVALIAACAYLTPCESRGVIVDSTLLNATRPTDDPGWDNVSDEGSSLVYLGDGWILTAGHIGVPGKAFFTGESFDLIPGVDIRLLNPSGMELTETTDLRMFRLKDDPGLPSINISSVNPPIGGQLTLIGRGRAREELITRWQVNMDGDDWTWTELLPGQGGGNFRGFKVLDESTRDTRWGHNRIANDTVLGETDPGHTTIVEVRNGGITRDVVSLISIFDDANGLPFEGQAVPGDSGGGVFYKRNGQWELAGIINATLTFPDQRPEWAVYGMASTFADLSTYRDQILNIMADTNYSIPGDINLDGIVSGDATGPIESDDLSAFVAGWLSEFDVAGLDSWKMGDLNQDALVDLHDFAILRNAHPAAASIAQQLAGGAAIPEPGSLVQMLAGVITAAVCLTRRK